MTAHISSCMFDTNTNLFLLHVALYSRGKYVANKVLGDIIQSIVDICEVYIAPLKWPAHGSLSLDWVDMDHVD